MNYWLVGIVILQLIKVLINCSLRDLQGLLKIQFGKLFQFVLTL